VDAPPLDRALDFTDHVVLVTGGTRGVGRGIAQRFLEADADVVVCGRHEPERAIEHEARFAAFLPADVRDQEQVDGLVRTIVERYGRLDVLVNNAGGSPPAETATASGRFTTSIIALNLVAPLLCTQAVFGVMRDQPTGGSVVNISSVSGMRPTPSTAAYGAAKAGLVNLTQTLAVELAPKVRVNCVTAGLVVTEQAHLFYGDAAGIAAVGRTVPLGRMADPDDVADVVLFCASPLARYVSGANIVVHGGGELPAYLDASTAS
jgi:NAD(P)-dependent dehydrogenase (short-subunit alcohol dehydrogenase family)